MIGFERRVRLFLASKMPSNKSIESVGKVFAKPGGFMHFAIIALIKLQLALLQASGPPGTRRLSADATKRA